MKTEILPTDSAKARAAAVARAAATLARGECVALPTETVYGLAADATNPDALARIFEAKHRPLFDPLIVHVSQRDDVAAFADIPAFCEGLIDRFWPGPLTLILPRRGTTIPDLATSGLATVAVRMPVHPIFQEVLAAFGKPLAAPSANRFGRISPTTPEHVVEELDGRIPLVLAAGPTAHGVESTIVQLEGGRLRILRNGPITPEQLAEFGEVIAPGAADSPIAPGQMKSHYAPGKPLVLSAEPSAFPFDPEKRYALLRFSGGETVDPRFSHVETLSPTGDLREAARNLFAAMRRLDATDAEAIVAERIPEHGLGHAIMDRLGKAAARE